jgi:hypothetical protein
MMRVNAGSSFSAALLCVTRVADGTAFLMLLGALASGPAQATDLGDLTIPSSRVPDWYSICGPGERGCDIDLPDTSGWTTVEATNASAIGSATGGRCTAAADPADGADDGVAIRCMTDNLPPRYILEFPAGTYNFSVNSGELWIRRSELVLRGVGSATIFKSHFVGNGGNGSGGAAPLCRPEPHALVCGGGGFVGSEDNPGQVANYTTIAWTAGYAAGTTVITVSNAATLSLATGDWIVMKGDVPSNLDPGKETYIHGMHKIASVSGNDVTLERGLRHDWNLSGNQIVAKFDPIYNVGIESIRFTEVDTTSGNRYKYSLSLMSAVESWVRGCEFGTVYSHQLQLGAGGGGALRSPASRILVQGNNHEYMISAESANANMTQLMLEKTFDNVVENNVYEEEARPITIQDYAAGNVVAYNFFQPTGANNTNRCKAAVFWHGDYPSETLVEGNQVNLEGTTDGGDTCNLSFDGGTWGSNGPRHVLYRNRVEGGTAEAVGSGAIRVSWTQAGEISTPSVNAIGNIVRHFSWGNGGNFDATIPDAWLERNVYRSTLNLTPNAQNVQNHNGETAPAAWSGFYAPDSLYRNARPLWWCDEACLWQGQAGIGAFGDDFSQRLCSLPAQLRAARQACGATDPPPPQPPMAPILLN